MLQRKGKGRGRAAAACACAEGLAVSIRMSTRTLSRSWRSVSGLKVVQTHCLGAGAVSRRWHCVCVSVCFSEELKASYTSSLRTVCVCLSASLSVCCLKASSG
jgi:hypothetical protein